jgi:hypothetical protein
VIVKLLAELILPLRAAIVAQSARDALSSRRRVAISTVPSRRVGISRACNAPFDLVRNNPLSIKSLQVSAISAAGKFTRGRAAVGQRFCVLCLDTWSQSPIYKSM